MRSKVLIVLGKSPLALLDPREQQADVQRCRPGKLCCAWRTPSMKGIGGGNNRLHPVYEQAGDRASYAYALRN